MTTPVGNQKNVFFIGEWSLEENKSWSDPVGVQRLWGSPSGTGRVFGSFTRPPFPICLSLARSLHPLSQPTSRPSIPPAHYVLDVLHRSCRHWGYSREERAYNSARLRYDMCLLRSWGSCQWPCPLPLHLAAPKVTWQIGHRKLNMKKRTNFFREETRILQITNLWA